MELRHWCTVHAYGVSAAPPLISRLVYVSVFCVSKYPEFNLFRIDIG